MERKLSAVKDCQVIKKSGSVTLNDVAREAGVSLKTASRTLNDSPELRPATAARVRETMERLGYQPNELARGLKSKRSAAIAMIAPNLADPFTATAIQAVQDLARARGYVVILASSGGDPSLEQSELQAMARRQIDGIILIAASSTKSNLKSPIANQIPIVVFDEPVRGADVDTITVTNRKAAREATEHSSLTVTAGFLLSALVPRCLPVLSAWPVIALPCGVRVGKQLSCLCSMRMT